MTKINGAIRIHARVLVWLTLILSVDVFAISALAVSADDFKAALAKAEAANKQAGDLKNRWTTTEEAVTAAKKAANAGKFDDAVKFAEQAEALAKASIAQAKEQATAWTQAVIH